MITIGIECEPLENDHYGVARMIQKSLEQLAARPKLAQTHRFILYFNKRIPGEPFLNSPLFEKKIVGLSRWKLPSSFSLYYYALLPLELWWNGPDLMYWPNYMLPLIHPPFVKSLVMLTEDIAQEMHNPKLGFRYRLAYQIFATWAAKTATRIMAISHASAQNLAKAFHISPKRIVVNELGIDPAQSIRGATRTQPYLLFVGQAFERRRLRETLLAFERIAPKYPNLQFVFAGRDKYHTPLKLGPQVIHFAGVTDQELATLYANAQAVTYISGTEAFGLPPLEALAYGTPAVVADTPVSREIFREHAFFVADPSDISQITNALEQALADTAKRAQIRASAPDILTRYTWSRHADRLLKITDEILHAQ